MNALIGHSGFVGSTLKKQTDFDYLYRSTNIAEITGKSFDTVICAGAPAQKWLANKDPETDAKTINTLIEHLKTVQCKTFVLISTVDVFKNPLHVDENSVVDTTDLHAYGLHRRQLELFVEQHFTNHLIVRLPALVGFGLRKNIIFDLLNNNNLSAIDSRGVFQFYPMVNLYDDVQQALKLKLKLVHLTAEPISVAQVASQGFHKSFENILINPPAYYDMRSCYAKAFGGNDYYQYSARETLLAIRAYAQAEKLTELN